MTGIYALISPDGRLEFHDGVPERIWKDADPHNSAPSTFAIQHASRSALGLEGHAGGSSALVCDAYPPNHVAGSLVAALGGSERYFFGNLTIYGSRILPGSDEVARRGLSEAQQQLITAVHAVVSQPIGNV